MSRKKILSSIYSILEPLGYEEGSFSLKNGFGVFGADIMTTGIPADLYRFYLISIRPETENSSFNWSDFALTVNTQLINNIGNFVNRYNLHVNSIHLIELMSYIYNYIIITIVIHF